MGFRHVFDQGEAQARARNLPILRAGNAIELLGQPRYLTGRHSYPPIRHFDDGVAVLATQA